MQYAVIIAVLAVIALAVWLLRRRKIETIETRVYRLSDPQYIEILVYP